MDFGCIKIPKNPFEDKKKLSFVPQNKKLVGPNRLKNMIFRFPDLFVPVYILRYMAQGVICNRCQEADVYLRNRAQSSMSKKGNR